MNQREILQAVRDAVGSDHYFGNDGALESFRRAGILAQTQVYKQMHDEPTEDVDVKLNHLLAAFEDLYIEEYCENARQQFRKELESGMLVDEGRPFLENSLATFGETL